MKRLLFHIHLQGNGLSRGVEDTINKLQKLFELRSQNDTEILVKEVEKRGMIIFE